MRFDNHDFSAETNDLKQRTLSSNGENIEVYKVECLF